MESRNDTKVVFGHPDDPRIRSRVGEWDDFKALNSWRDIVSFLEDRKMVALRELRGVSDLSAMLKLQQELDDLELMLNLPNFLKAQRMQQDEEDKQNRNEE